MDPQKLHRRKTSMNFYSTGGGGGGGDSGAVPSTTMTTAGNRTPTVAPKVKKQTLSLRIWNTLSRKQNKGQNEINVNNLTNSRSLVVPEIPAEERDKEMIEPRKSVSHTEPIKSKNLVSESIDVIKSPARKSVPDPKMIEPARKSVSDPKMVEPARKSVSQEPGRKSGSHEPARKSVSHEPAARKSVSQEPAWISLSQEPARTSVSYEPARKSVSQEPARKSVSYEPARKSVSQAEIIESRKSVSHVEMNVKSVTTFLNVKVMAVDMPGFMQVHAFKCAKRSYECLDNFSSKHMAYNMKKEFDRVYGPAWHCIVGSSFGSFVTHSTGCFIYFSIENLFILIFKTKVQKALE